MSWKTAEQHYNDVISLGQPLPAAEVAVSQARGLVLVEDVYALHSVPPFTNSAMDGFAVRTVDVVPGQALAVTDDVPAGRADVPSLAPGTAIRVMTGAQIPIGADSILQVELTENPEQNMLTAPPAQIVPTAKPKLGAHFRLEGEDIQAGQLAFRAGAELTSAHLASLVSLGFSSATIHRRPLVGILTTGDELAAPGQSLEPGHVPDSNTALVSALVAERGGAPRMIGIRGDDPNGFAERLREAAAQVDLIITTGGVSAGAFDVVRAAMSDDGVVFEKVAMQPGKPQGWGNISQSAPHTSKDFDFPTIPTHVVPILCLPGNPVSVFVSMQLFGLPLIDALMGRPTRSFDALFTPETLGAGWLHKTGREQFMPVMRDANGNVVPAHQGGSKSHMIATLPYATGLARVPADAAEVRAGETIGVLWFAGRR